jgi:hypothetical protein
MIKAEDQRLYIASLHEKFQANKIALKYLMATNCTLLVDKDNLINLMKYRREIQNGTITDEDIIVDLNEKTVKILDSFQLRLEKYGFEFENASLDQLYKLLYDTLI